ncbi:hypothetical protein BGX38DRAFT_664094 [Terfezia claveryi]|nr:hypothetical protein BGX38DRAFT_664094 [Terfezia claveryi]
MKGNRDPSFLDRINGVFICFVASNSLKAWRTGDYNLVIQEIKYETAWCLRITNKEEQRDAPRWTNPPKTQVSRGFFKAKGSSKTQDVQKVLQSQRSSKPRGQRLLQNASVQRVLQSQKAPSKRKTLLDWTLMYRYRKCTHQYYRKSRASRV